MESNTARVCIITLRNLFNTACLPRYASVIPDGFDIIYWDQHGLDESCGARRYYKYSRPVQYGSGGRCNKLLGYLGFRKFALNILQKKQYEKLIILPTQTALVLYGSLYSRYRNRYMIDIRDYTMEHNFFFRMIEKKIIQNSAFMSVTSRAFLRFLPEHDFVVSHNITDISPDIIAEYRARQKGTENPIIISCIGSIRFIRQFEKVIAFFRNDERFRLRFIGRGSEQLQPYCEANGVENVELIGLFPPENTLNYYLSSDVILNLYGNNTPLLDYALSNKLYYAATLGMPILVCPDTYMETVSMKNGFGFPMMLIESTEKDALARYYRNMDWEAFYRRCDSFIESVLQDECVFQRRVKEFGNEKATV